MAKREVRTELIWCRRLAVSGWRKTAHQRGTGNRVVFSGLRCRLQARGQDQVRESVPGPETASALPYPVPDHRDLKNASPRPLSGLRFPFEFRLSSQPLPPVLGRDGSPSRPHGPTDATQRRPYPRQENFSGLGSRPSGAWSGFPGSGTGPEPDTRTRSLTRTCSRDLGPEKCLTQPLTANR